MDDIRIYFVIFEKYKDENEVPEIMSQAFEICKQYVKNVYWVKENSLNTLDLHKTDIVVFEEFTGENFKNVKETRSTRILGPWVLSICLTEGKEIPKYPWPIYNVAMYNLIIACSHLPRKIKTQLKEKIELMGGCCTDTLVDKNTHLVTGSTKSEKYSVAAERGLKLMLPTWVEAVWKESQNCNVRADDEKFAEYRCLPFYNLTICSTGITSQSKRSELMELIKRNGGTMTGKLNLATTDVLICYGENGCDSEKYKAARKFPEISCVTIDWVYNSITKGYALKPDLYQIKTHTPTPTKVNDSVNANFRDISIVTMPNVSSIDETVNAGVSRLNCTNMQQRGVKRKCSEIDDNAAEIEKLDVKRVKRAGQFLDGCSVYLIGFEVEQRDKLIKILNICGATRYDDISDRVTHVIVGDPSCQELKVIKAKSYHCSFVKLRWLLDSIEAQKSLIEEEYLVEISVETDDSAGLPVCKKGLNLLKTNKTITENELEEHNRLTQSIQAEQEDDDVLRQYLQPAIPRDDSLATLFKNDHINLNPKETSISQSNKNKDDNNCKALSQISDYSLENNSTLKSIFRCDRFLLVGFNEEETVGLKEQIEADSGEVVPKSFKGIPDYLVAPIFPSYEILQTAQEIVNDLFVSESTSEATKVGIEYYHRPFVLSDVKPLKHCVITVSSYSGFERVFLKTLISKLGAVSQEQFARITSQEKGILASSHLVSPEASGKKYQAAIKWKLPIVTKDWLLECAKQGRHVSEKEYIVGDSIIPENKNIIFSENIQNKTELAANLPSTPISKKNNDAVVNKTPLDGQSKKTNEGCNNQITPISKIIEEARKDNLLEDIAETPKKYFPWDPKTPKTPKGGVESKWTPGTRKGVEVFLNNLPEFKQPNRRNSTPLAVIKEKLRSKFFPGNTQEECTLRDDNAPESSSTDIESAEKTNKSGFDIPQPEVVNENNTQNLLINDKLQQLENMLSSTSGGRRSSRTFQSTIPAPSTETESKNSQVFTVGWDFTEREIDDMLKDQEPLRIFMISGVEHEARQLLTSQIESLGATVSNSNTYDPSSTHLLCLWPGRNEKVLSCMAAGKWVLHVSYMQKCVEAGKFLDEEEFEFGNPKSEGKWENKEKDAKSRLDCMHWWRKEITRRGYGAFNDMRAILVANKRGPIIRVIEAGGGTVINISPPFDDTVHATHCLIDVKCMPDPSLYYPLARQGVFCVNTLYISEFLHRTARSVKECVLPAFSKFYA